MPDRDWKFRIEDILAAMTDISQLVENLTYEDFCADPKTVKAVLYNLAVIGEAARRVPQEMQRQYPAVPWREMGDMRNLVIHEYFGVDLEIVWETIRHELAPLAPLLTGILSA